MRVTMPSVIRSYLVFGLSSILLSAAGTAQAAKCCRVTVEGCGKQANVCIAKDCNNATYSEARKQFSSAFNCPNAKMKTSIGTCGGQKCDLDKR